MSQSSPHEGPGISDYTLLNGFAVGDIKVGRAFVRRFQGRVYGVAISLLGDPGMAEDVAQEAFVRAWRNAAAYDPARGSVSAWLLRTTHNLAIDTLRRHRPQPADAETVAALTPPTTATAVEDAAVSSDLAGQARAAVARLPPAQATALLLAAFYGCTTKQIAVSEHIPLGTAKTRIRQGLRILRAQLADLDNTEPTASTLC
jgi:RNA polymerase sigma factor (sigma-70 family)